MPDPFRGSKPKVLCRDVSGADCDKWLDIDARDCGDRTHVRLRRDEVKNTSEVSGESISRPRPPRPTLIVDEDYELIGPDRDLETDRAWPDLGPESLDASRLWVAIHAQKAFTAHHGVDAETAIREIRLLAQAAMSDGNYWRRSDGFHGLEYKGFELSLSPDGEVVTFYTTRHYERMPSQVLAKMRSRFRKGGGKKDPGPPMPLSEMASNFDPETVRISPTALRLYAKRMALNPEDRSTLVGMRSEIRESARTGTWRLSTRGPTAYILAAPDRHWIVAADDGTIVSHYVPDAE